MQNVLNLVYRELHTIAQEHRYQQISTTSWCTLSQIDSSDNPFTSNDDDHWELSEEPYENWIADPEATEEVSHLLNLQHLLDGRD